MAARISEVLCSAGTTGFFFDDQRAIKRGAVSDGFFYPGEPATAGFDAIRMPGESVSVILLLDDGQIAHGDCAAIQYSGAGGRYPAFRAREIEPLIMQCVAPLLRGAEPTDFRALAGEIEALTEGGRPIHSAVRYGATQAALDAVAKAGHELPCEVIAREYGLDIRAEPVRIFTQSGDDRYTNADKMILKGADVLPHGLINNIPDKLGASGEKLLGYVEWLRDRITGKRASPDYRPEIHIDVYGTVGIVFDNDTKRMGEYLKTLGEAAAPFRLRIEGPIDAGALGAQCEALAALRSYLRERDSEVAIVADEWCNSLDDMRQFIDRGAVDMIQIKTPVLGGIQNSVEAVLLCKGRGVDAYLGGTCNETDRSAQLCVHVALATRPYQMLAKPGMGVDEGFMIVTNEMRRTLAILRHRRGGPRAGEG
ncbi:MAG: methylaspartate ammonia-lyase [Planctomycetota bacterium]|jgi:methylaspartate ammonia-lyase